MLKNEILLQLRNFVAEKMQPPRALLYCESDETNEKEEQVGRGSIVLSGAARGARRGCRGGARRAELAARPAIFESKS